MKNNNHNNFGLLFKKIFVEQKKNILSICAGYIGFWIIIGIVTGCYGNVPSPSSFTLYILFSGLLCAIVASRMFYDTKTKEGIVSLLMIPASAGNKFITRLIIILPLMLLAVCLGYLIYASVSVLTCGIYYEIWYPIFNPFLKFSEHAAVLLGLIVSFFLLNESLFILGATLWSKRPFLKTVIFIACLFIVFWFFTWICVKIVKYLNIYFIVTDKYALAWSFFGIVLMIAIGITIFAFFTFKRKTIA